MPRVTRKRHSLVGLVLATGAVLALVLEVGALAGAGSAASAAAPANTSPPTLSGTPQQGQTLTGSKGSWSGDPTDYNYFWTRCDHNGGNCGDIKNATAATYTLTSADVGNTVRFKVEAVNADGNTFASSVPSAVIAAAAPTAPTNTSPPTLSGTPREGQTLTGSKGSWSGNPTDYNYFWSRCDRDGSHCNDINKATAGTLTLTSNEVDHTVRFKVEAKNAGGSTFASSAPSAVVTAAAATTPANTSPPSVSGTAQQGHTLTGHRGSWSGNPTDYNYFWTRCDRNGGNCANIAGATKSTYTLTASDVGRTIRFKVQARNAGGSTSASSVPTAVVTSSAPATTTAGRTISVTQVSPPTRLVVNKVRFSPNPTRSRAPITARFHVSDTRGYSVQGALVYAIGLPYGWARHSPEAVTDSSGWATVIFYPTRSMPVGRTAALVVFVRARKPGDPVLTGVSTRRLVQERIRR
jgi:K+-transporting ATPase c subunit